MPIKTDPPSGGDVHPGVRPWRLLAQPCPSCPWRLDQRAQDIPGFNLDQARGLAETCPDGQGYGPSFGAPMFACHQTHEGAELPCAGWLAMVGHRHPNVRLALIQGHLPAAALRPGPDWPTLHDSYDDVLNKLMGSVAPE